MLRRLLASVLLIGLSASGCAGQDAPQDERIYVAHFNIRYSDIPAWSEYYYQNSVPVLEELVERGMLTRFNVWMHHTGGQYTIRQGLVGNDDTNFNTVWDAYLGALMEADAAAFEAQNRMILAHEDEIWNIDVLEVPEGEPPQYLYEAAFRVNFADLESWVSQWATDVYPLLDQLMADGMLRGYVAESHNTGGSYNWKILYFSDAWDDMDEMEAAIFEAVPLTHPIWSMFTAHKDELWQALPPPA